MAEDLIFVGMLQSEQEAREKIHVSVAGNNFQKRFIHAAGIREVINIRYLDDDSGNQSGRRVNYKYELSGGLRYGPKIIRIICKILWNSLCFSWILSRDVNNKKLVFYNIDYHNASLILLAKFIHKRKVIVIAADFDRRNSGLINKLFAKIYSIVDGVISLRKTFKFNENVIVVPAILSEVEKNSSGTSEKNLQSVLFSGSIGYTTGFDLFLEVAKRCNEFRFIITGKPFQITESEVRTLVNAAKLSGANIEYLGMLGKDEYTEIMRLSAFGVSLRNPDELEHEFNFPSKITEYASNGLVVLSTLTYEELDSEILVHVDFDAENIISTLRKLTWSRDIYENIQNTTVNAVRKHSLNNVRNILVSFLRNV